MKRIVLAAFSTLAALVVLFSYPTSTGQSGSTAAEPVSSAKVISGGQRTTSATTGQGPDPAPTAGSTAATPGAAAGGSTTAASAGPATGATDTAAPQTAAAQTAAAAPSVTVDGAQEMTRYGVVQVRVVITDGAITDVTALEYPQTDRKDIQINNRALPLLKAKVLAAQSAKIDGVSGATFTSDGYITSLQSALDAAGFAQ